MNKVFTPRLGTIFATLSAASIGLRLHTRNLRGRLCPIERAVGAGRFAQFTQRKKAQLPDRLSRYARHLGLAMKPTLIAAGIAAGLTLATPSTAQTFTAQTGTDNPLNGVADRATFLDIDNDGDQDAFIGESTGTIKYYKNTGSNSSPTFIKQTGADNPLNGVDVGNESFPTSVDIDNDGDKDVFIGELDGIINYYKNTGTAAAPVFTVQTGVDNPFDGVDLGGDSYPTFVDIDNDGDKDAFIGEFFGTIKYYKNTTCTAPTTLTATNITTTTASIGWTAGGSQTAWAVGVCGKNIPYNSSVTGAPTPSITYKFEGATTGTGNGNGSGSFFNVGVTTVTLTATNSCGTANCSFTVTFEGTPTLTLGTIPTICAGATSFTIPYTGTRTPTSYSISGTGITTATDAPLTNPITVNLSAAASGTSIPFTLTVKNVSGCTSANIASSVTVNPPLSISLPTAGFILCQGGETTIRATASGGTGIFQYSLNGSAYQTNPVFSVRTGNYIITAKDGNNCTVSTASTNVRDGSFALQCPSSSTVDAAQMGANGSVPTSVSGNATIFGQCITIAAGSMTATDQVFDVNCGVVSPQNNSFSASSLVDMQQVIVRTFAAKTGVVTYSCAQTIFVRQPKLEDVVFPRNVTLTCPNVRTEPTEAGVGAPTIGGTTLTTTAQKGLSATYSDVRTTTPTGFTIQRTWTVSKCGTVRTVVQTITVPTCTAPSVAGSIGRENGTAIPATTLLYNSTTGRTDSTTGATYNFANLLTNSTIRVKPARPNTDWTSGVTMLDVNILSRHLLDVNRMTSPYSIISSDVNNDGEVDATDMLLMQRLILRKIDNLPNNNSWRFVMKNHVFRNPSAPLASDFPEVLVVSNIASALANGDFVAIKVGDLNQSAGTVNIRGSVKPFVLNTEDLVLEKGKTYQIPIQLTPSVSSLQFTLNVDKNAAIIENVENGNLPNFTDNNTGLFQKEGIITAAWYRKEGQILNETDNFTMMTITLKPTITARLSEIMTINSVYTEGVAYDAKGTGLSVQLAFGNQKSSGEKAVLLPNRPNPFTNETVLSFTLPEASTAKLTVCDLLGKVLMVRDQAFAKGVNEVVFDATKTPSVSSGLFIVRLQTATGVMEQKIVLQR